MFAGIHLDSVGYTLYTSIDDLLGFYRLIFYVGGPMNEATKVSQRVLWDQKEKFSLIDELKTNPLRSQYT